MIEKTLSFTLPTPWQNKSYQSNRLGKINYLVGPNGSGKSRFAETLRSHLGSARLLGTDRLSGMEQNYALKNIFGDRFAEGLAKNQFPNLKTAGQMGSGIDTLILLDERTDLRVQVEATLSHLFNRRIFLDWDSGNLVARAVLGDSGTSYRLDREECHGIKELLVLLTHLYNDQHPFLIIDEPELNLHPQFQAFFMQEVRRVAGEPRDNSVSKIIFLITHSPFILDFRNIDDVKSVISFSLDHSVPRQMLDLDTSATDRLASLVPRLNVHHKQLFFSDNPIFVEGILDAQLIGSIQESRGVSIASAGSCIIDAGGCEEVNRYLELCMAFGKKAHFLYDLDSLYGGNLRACVKDDGTIQGFLMTAGIGSDFGKYCGELDGKLTAVIDTLLSCQSPPQTLLALLELLRSFGPRKEWDHVAFKKARVATLTCLSRHKDDVGRVVTSGVVADIEGRLSQIVAALRTVNVNILSGGTIERYLPSYLGHEYILNDAAKRNAVYSEIGQLTFPMTDSVLSARYGALFEAVQRLPSKASVNFTNALRDYLSRFIHDLQISIASNPTWELTQIQSHMLTIQKAASKLFTVNAFTRNGAGQFSATISVRALADLPLSRVDVTHLTNAGMGGFSIERIPPEQA